MIKISNLTARYGKKIVLQDVSLEIENGQAHIFLGKNGSGKTTFFNVLYRLLKNYRGKYNGEITYNGDSLKRSHISYLISDNFFYKNITGFEYLDIVSCKEGKAFFSDLNTVFELPLEDYIQTYSKGMRKKISLMGVFATKAPIYLLDEPFSDLDLSGIEITLKIINRLKEEGRTILLSTHMLKELNNIQDQVYLIDNKSILQYESIEELKKAYRSTKNYEQILRHFIE